MDLRTLSSMEELQKWSVIKSSSSETARFERDGFFLIIMKEAPSSQVLRMVIQYRGLLVQKTYVRMDGVREALKNWNDSLLMWSAHLD